MKARKITYVEGEGRLVGAEHRRGRRPTGYAGRNVVLATGSYARTLPGLEIDGRVITSDQALTPGLRAGARRRARRRRDRRRVRLASGSPSAPTSPSSRRCPGWSPPRTRRSPRSSSARSASARSPSRPASASPGVEQHDDGVHGHRSRTARPSRPTCCSSPSAAARSPPASATRRPGVAHGPRLRPHRRAAAHQRRRTSTPSATSSPACSSRTAASSRASSSPRRSPGSTRRSIDEAGIPRVTYCDPEVASVGLTEAAGQGEVRRGRGRDLRVQPRRQRQEPDPQDRRASSSWSASKDGPVVGVHMVGARVGELIGEAQLIYNWEAYPEDVAPLDPRAPDPERGARRGAPRPGRQAAARARLTPTLATRPPDRSHRLHDEGDLHTMSERVTMPALGESVTEGTVTRWLKQVGDTVEVDEPLLEVSTDKVDTEIPSPVAGVLQEILVGEDETVEVGAELAVIGDGAGGGAGGDRRPAAEAPRRGRAAAAAGAAEPAPRRPPSRSPRPSRAAGRGAAPGRAARRRPRPAAPATAPRSTMPALGESRHRGHRHPLAQGRSATTVEVDEPLLEVSTDKVDTEIPSPVAGTLLRDHASARTRPSQVGAELAVIGGAGAGGRPPAPGRRPEPAGAEPAAAAGPEAEPSSEPEPPAAAGAAAQAARRRQTAPTPAAPAAGRRAAHGRRRRRRRRRTRRATSRRWSASSPPSTASTCRPLTGTGVGGRIRKQDVLDAAEAAKAAAAPAAAGRRPPPRPPPAAGAAAAAAGGLAQARHHREDDPAAQGHRPADGRVAAGLGAADHRGRGRRHPDRPAARPGQGRLRAPRGRQALASCRSSPWPRSRRSRPTRCVNASIDTRPATDHLPRRGEPRHRRRHRARPARPGHPGRRRPQHRRPGPQDRRPGRAHPRQQDQPGRARPAARSR